MQQERLGLLTIFLYVFYTGTVRELVLFWETVVCLILGNSHKVYVVLGETGNQPILSWNFSCSYDLSYPMT